MKLKRNDWFYGKCRSFTDKAVDFWFGEIFVEGADVIPKDGAALIASKHQFYWDIPVQGWVLNNFVGRPATWFMKSSLPGWLDYTGANRVHQKKVVASSLMSFARKRKALSKVYENARGGDGVVLYEGMDWEDFKNANPDKFYIDSSKAQDIIGCALLQNEFDEIEFNEFNKEAVAYTSWMYAQGGIGFLQPEGTRVRGKMGKIDMPLIEHARHMSELYEQDIPLVLIGMNYHDMGKHILTGNPTPKYGSKLDVKIARMDWDTPNLEKAITSEIARLSGL